MNENLNLVEILKDCPKGTKLYSLIYGYVELERISNDENDKYPIFIRLTSNTIDCVAKDGRYIGNYDGECVLFPSKEQRDWSRFKQLVKPKFKVGDKIVYSLGKRVGAPGSYGIISEITDDKYIFTDTSYAFIRNQDGWELVPDKKPKFDPKTLCPFDKILVRDSDECWWRCALYSHTRENQEYKYMTMQWGYKCCIPYNDDTKNLVGTTDGAPEYYRYWED